MLKSGAKKQQYIEHLLQHMHNCETDYNVHCRHCKEPSKQAKLAEPYCSKCFGEFHHAEQPVSTTIPYCDHLYHKKCVDSSKLVTMQTSNGKEIKVTLCSVRNDAIKEKLSMEIEKANIALTKTW